MHLLKPGQYFDELPDSYVIFITENDVIGKGKPMYTVERRIVNIDEPFEDGEHIIYVNGTNEDSSTELGKLMHDFRCTDPDDMYFEPLAKKARYFKENERGVGIMCKVLEDMRTEVARETAERKSVEIALNLFKLEKLSLEEIAESAGLPLERVKELAAPEKV